MTEKYIVKSVTPGLFIKQFDTYSEAARTARKMVEKDPLDRGYRIVKRTERVLSEFKGHVEITEETFANG